METSHQPTAAMSPAGGAVCDDMPAPTALASCHSLAGARDVNQDVAITQQVKLQDGAPVTLALVADGMGGHEDGEVAAREAVMAVLASIVSLLLQAAQKAIAWDSAAWLERAVVFANHWVARNARNNGNAYPMGTTLVAALIHGPALYLASVGDSRAYRYSRAYRRAHGRLERLTRDDSVVEAFVEAGILTPSEAEFHPRANEITHALGLVDSLDGVTVHAHEVIPGDIYLLCSDGLWKGAGDALEEALEALSQGPYTQQRLDAAASTMAPDALKRGADDNISLALLWAAPDTTGPESTSHLKDLSLSVTQPQPNHEEE